MLFGKIVSFVRTVAFRLTLWYGAIFSACGVALFIICYLLVASSLRWQIDRSLHESFLQIQTAWQNGGLEAAQADMLRETSAEGAKGIYFRIAGPDGRTLASTDEKNWREVADHARLYWRQDPPGRVVETISVGKGGKEARLFEDSLEEGVVLQVAKSLRYDQQQLERLQRIFAALLALFVATAIALGWVMARRALSGVEQIRNTAERIAKGALDSRVPVRGIGDEIDQLALTFNTMLARIQKVVSEMREMGYNIEKKKK
ncbi:HAMP domain-containing protein, partial [Candidatus Sumerlaeota bacterium]|nr:HAMP domain-containing protein [Candidatus Sumerlaeota bacterium]